MKKLIFPLVALFAFMVQANAQTQLFHTDFSDTPTTWSSTGTSMGKSGDYDWVTTTYSYFSDAGGVTLSSLTIASGSKIVVKWGSHDGRLLYLASGTTPITSFIPTVDQITESSYDFTSDLGSTALSLGFVEGTGIITEITVTSGSGAAVSLVQATGVSAKGIDGKILISEAAGQKVEVLDLNGTVVYRGVITADEETITVQKTGLYIVRVAGQAVKVLVK